MELIAQSPNLQEYLESTAVIDWHTSAVRETAVSLSASADAEEGKAKRVYEWVRDEIPHSADAGHEIVTCRASDVLKQATGICYAKAHLLAALLRALEIPAGLCYQVLRYDDQSDRLVLHGLNAVYSKRQRKWFRVDPRGNKPGVDAQFSIGEEKLAFPVDPAMGESDCSTIFREPLPRVVRCLATHGNVAQLMANLPQTV